MLVGRGKTRERGRRGTRRHEEAGEGRPGSQLVPRTRRQAPAAAFLYDQASNTMSPGVKAFAVAWKNVGGGKSENTG